MFRPATIKEVENLLRSQHILRGHGRDPVLPVFPPPRAEGYANKEEKDKAYKKALSDQVRESMLAQASKCETTSTLQLIAKLDHSFFSFFFAMPSFTWFAHAV